MFNTTVCFGLRWLNQKRHFDLRPIANKRCQITLPSRKFNSDEKMAKKNDFITFSKPFKKSRHLVYSQRLKHSNVLKVLLSLPFNQLP